MSRKDLSRDAAAAEEPTGILPVMAELGFDIETFNEAVLFLPMLQAKVLSERDMSRCCALLGLINQFLLLAEKTMLPEASVESAAVVAPLLQLKGHTKASHVRAHITLLLLKCVLCSKHTEVQMRKYDSALMIPDICVFPKIYFFLMAPLLSYSSVRLGKLYDRERAADRGAQSVEAEAQSPEAEAQSPEAEDAYQQSLVRFLEPRFGSEWSSFVDSGASIKQLQALFGFIQILCIKSTAPAVLVRYINGHAKKSFRRIRYKYIDTTYSYDVERINPLHGLMEVLLAAKLKYMVECGQLGEWRTLFSYALPWVVLRSLPSGEQKNNLFAALLEARVYSCASFSREIRDTKMSNPQKFGYYYWGWTTNLIRLMIQSGVAVTQYQFDQQDSREQKVVTEYKKKIAESIQNMLLRIVSLGSQQKGATSSKEKAKSAQKVVPVQSRGPASAEQVEVPVTVEDKLRAFLQDGSNIMLRRWFSDPQIVVVGSIHSYNWYLAGHNARGIEFKSGILDRYLILHQEGNSAKIIDFLFLFSSVLIKTHALFLALRTQVFRKKLEAECAGAGKQTGTMKTLEGLFNKAVSVASSTTSYSFADLTAGCR